MKTIYKVIKIVTEYKHNMVYSDEIYTKQYDLDDFKSEKSALKFLNQKYKEFETKNNTTTYQYEEARYTQLKEHVWKYQTVYDIYHSHDYQIWNFVIVKIYID